MGILLYPYYLILFWYRDFTLGTLRTSWEIFVYVSEVLSVPLLLKTFFKPLKNEYRQGLVWFSIIMGVIIKTFILSVTVTFLLGLAAVLIALDLLVALLPVILIWFLIRE
jgi:hypothetical protein